MFGVVDLVLFLCFVGQCPISGGGGKLARVVVITVRWIGWGSHFVLEGCADGAWGMCGANYVQ